jgi:hypothetical protein
VDYARGYRAMLWVESQEGYCAAALIGAGLVLVTARRIRPIALESRVVGTGVSESLAGTAGRERSTVVGAGSMA